MDASALIEALDPETIRRLSLEKLRVLDMQDVIELCPWSEKTVREMVTKTRQIPMVYTNGRWVITAKEFARAAAAGFPWPQGCVRKSPEEKYRELKQAARQALRTRDLSHLRKFV